MTNRLAGAANHDITRLLGRAAEGDDTAFEQVAAWAYAELERLAATRSATPTGRGSSTATSSPRTSW